MSTLPAPRPRPLAWLLSTDARTIGHVHLVVSALALLAGVVAALAVQAERLTRGPTVVGPEGFSRLYAAHGVLMVHLVLVPALSAVLGNLRLPAELGAENVAFPRLNRAMLWLFLAGAVAAIGGLAAGGLHHWAFDTQVGALASDATLVAMSGVLMLMVSAMVTGLNFIVSVHVRRDPRPMSLFAWGLCLMAGVQLLATPVFGLTVTVVFAERLFDVGLVDASLGGDPGLYRQFAWFAGHGTLTATLLPALGLALDHLTSAARRPVGSRGFAAGAMTALAALGVANWGQHLFYGGQAALADMVFSLFGLLATVPAAGLVFFGLRLLSRGEVRFSADALWSTAFLCLFAGGTVAGLFLSTLGAGGLLVASTFSAGHMHTFVAGGVLFAFMAGWPKASAPASETETADPPGGRVAALLAFAGASLAFLPMFVSGLAGMPRRMDDALPANAGLHGVAFLGGLVLVSGLALAVFGFWRMHARGVARPLLRH